MYASETHLSASAAFRTSDCAVRESGRLSDAGLTGPGAPRSGSGVSVAVGRARAAVPTAVDPIGPDFFAARAVGGPPAGGCPGSEVPLFVG